MKLFRRDKTKVTVVARKEYNLKNTTLTRAHFWKTHHPQTIAAAKEGCWGHLVLRQTSKQ